MELFEGTTEARKQAAAEAEGKRLTAKLLETEDISRKSGEMERESPLFYGTGSNLALFG